MAKATEKSSPSNDAGPAPTERDVESVDGTERPIDSGEVLSLLGDEHARRVLRSLVEQPRTAPELTDRLDASRATVYRRLDGLTAAGLVRRSTHPAAGGGSLRRFHVVADRISLLFGDDGVTAAIES